MHPEYRLGMSNLFKDGPLVSVIMPAYNARTYLRQAILSVLEQDYPNVELIVVDDGSTDGTDQEAERYGERVHLLRQKNRGPAAARNLGIRHAKGALIAFLDADDVWLPGKLSAQVAQLLQHPDVGLVYGGFVRWESNADGSFDPPPPAAVIDPAVPLVDTHSGWIYNELLFDNIVHIITAMVRREVVEELGGLDEHLPTGEDYDFWLRLSRRCKAHKLNRTLAYYRIHAASLTKIPRAENNEYKALLRALETFGPAGPDGIAVPQHKLTQRLFGLCFGHGYFHYWHGDPRVALSAFRQSLRHAPLKPKAWAYVALASFRSWSGARRPAV